MFSWIWNLLTSLTSVECFKLFSRNFKYYRPDVSCNFIQRACVHVCPCVCVDSVCVWGGGGGGGHQYMSFSVPDHLSNLICKFESHMMEFYGSMYRWLWSADFLGLASECTQISSNISSDKTHTDCSCFFSTRPVFPEIFSSVNNILLIWQEVNHQESNLEICCDTFIGFLPYICFYSKQ